MQLSRDYNCNHSVISRIIHNQSYMSDVPIEAVPGEVRKKIVADFSRGISINTIRTKYGVQQAVVRRILEEELSMKKEEKV